MKILSFANCITIKGANRSLICDLQRHDISLIPNDLFEILNKYQGKSIDEIKSNYDNVHHETIDQYFNFLFEKEYIFLDNYPKDFPPLKNQWFHYSKITNAIIELDNYIDNFENIIGQLIKLSCEYIEIRLYNRINLDSLKDLLNFLKKSKLNISGVELLVNELIDFNEYELQRLILDYPRLLKFTICSSKEDRLIRNKFNNQSSILLTKQNINSSKNCGVINKNYFTVNMTSYMESVNHNSCLNRKISIDVNGDIKNCPSMPESYGNIKDTTLEEAINKPGFKKYWNITKDDIEVCRDCEFRYICTDCRAYTERTKFSDEGLDLSKPLKCGYNPYTNEWAEWSTNPLKEKAIEYYGMKEIIENDKK